MSNIRSYLERLEKKKEEKNRRRAKIQKTNVNKQGQMVAWYCVPGTVDVLF